MLFLRRNLVPCSVHCSIIAEGPNPFNRRFLENVINMTGPHSQLLLGLLLIIIIIVSFGLFAFLIMYSVYFCLLPQIQGIWISWKYFLNSVTEHFPKSQRFIFTLHTLTHLKPAQTSRLQLQHGWGAGGVHTGRILWSSFHFHFYCILLTHNFSLFYSYLFSSLWYIVCYIHSQSLIHHFLSIFPFIASVFLDRSVSKSWR